MRAGVGLNDSNRLDWLKELRSLLLDWHRQRLDGVLACSALKQKYRHLLNSGLSYGDNAADNLVETDVNGNELTETVDLGLVFVLLNVPRVVIEKRLRMRHNHDIIRDVSILDSQFSTLEMPSSSAASGGLISSLSPSSNKSSHDINNNNNNNNSDVGEENRSYLCREKSDINHTSYLICVFDCSSEKTVSENARNIVQFLPIIQNYQLKI